MLQKIKSYAHWLLAWAAYWRYGRPSRKLIVIGVTGTKGKSTTSRLIASVLEAGGYKVGLLSTVEFQVGEKRWLNDKKMTMLGRGQIQGMLRAMVRAGCQYVVVETSSEGILQSRHIGLNYDIAIFTNLGTEHSERHGGFEKLRRDKGKLFAALKAHPKKLFGKSIAKTIIVNSDDEHAPFFASFLAQEYWTYGLQQLTRGLNVSPARQVRGVITHSSAKGTTFTVNDQPFHLPLVGTFNVPNALAAIAVGRSQGIDSNTLALGIASVTKVAGRMEFIEAGQQFQAIVDYAHEPMSLTALFTSLRELVQPDGRVIAVIGSDGGGRDVGKRAKMGEIAGQLCDYVIVSDVNCFDEDPTVIAEMLAEGARTAGKQDTINLFVQIDRRLGFRQAASLAQPGDVVVVTAKGTEPWIAVARGHKIAWDDRRVLTEELIALQKHA